MTTHQEDLDLLLSLQDDRVLETPPGSPNRGYLSDNGSPRERGQADMSAFRNVVEDCLESETKSAEKSGKLDRSKTSKDPLVEKFSGLRISNQVYTPAEVSERFADIRFVRLSAIKNLLAGDTIQGCWATVGVLTEKGYPKTSSIGQKYSIWKFGCLDENTISVFLFGDAYEQNCKEESGSVFALFNCGVRKAEKGSGFSLNVSYASRILKLGTSADYGVCKGKRSDGTPCTAVINKRKRVYCNFHISNSSKRYTTTRAELKGGNLTRTFRYPFKPEGIYMVDPTDRPDAKKSKQPVKVLSIEGLRKALSNGDKVTTNTHSQGLRFLNEMTAKAATKSLLKENVTPGQKKTSLEKRKSSTVNLDSSIKPQPDSKRQKPVQGHPVADKSKPGTAKMIELEVVSSDEEFDI